MTKKSKKKIEEAQVIDELKKFYVKKNGSRSTFIVVFGVSKLDVSMDYAEYDFKEGEQPSLKVCKDVYTRYEMVQKGLLPSVRGMLKDVTP